MAIEISKDVDRLRKEIDEMRTDLKALTRSIRETGLEKGKEALDQVEYLRRRAGKHAARAEARLERGIEERPFISVVAAFGVGFLLAKLLDSGR
jgi:ElaB/YqjD/DUF883 family membrane-anchored ribosome-binding protein